MAFHPTTMNKRGVLAIAAMAVLCAACSGPAPDAADARADAAGTRAGDAATTEAAPPAASGERVAMEAATTPDDAGATIGGDGSQVVLAPLSADDIDGADLAGELGCSFSTDAGTLLLAKGNVASRDPARGVVKVGEYVEPVTTPGGFDAMVKGATFSGAGKTIRIAPTGPAAGGGESPPAPATLTYDRADGARRSFAGQWQCGP